MLIKNPQCRLCFRMAHSHLSLESFVWLSNSYLKVLVSLDWILSFEKKKKNKDPFPAFWKHFTGESIKEGSQVWIVLLLEQNVNTSMSEKGVGWWFNIPVTHLILTKPQSPHRQWVFQSFQTLTSGFNLDYQAFLQILRYFQSIIQLLPFYSHHIKTTANSGGIFTVRIFFSCSKDGLEPLILLSAGRHM